ncbi:hypothetical protein [Bathymodiolus platifrons methanotrophic gill symbiont]|uniref:hypothetical protein n=1 Tax=Bathymodiolus platifrons methanotrophic gill symbiont TaxID=113268 RepID=UPI001C8F1A15|nr:hypothetical protein [Bathymodiolus platifrons methanotrophic gill symbiont]
MTKNKLNLDMALRIFSSSAFVQAEPYVYPAQGQNPDQIIYINAMAKKNSELIMTK